MDSEAATNADNGEPRHRNAPSAPGKERRERPGLHARQRRRFWTVLFVPPQSPFNRQGREPYRNRRPRATLDMASCAARILSSSVSPARWRGDLVFMCG